MGLFKIILDATMLYTSACMMRPPT